MAAFCPKCGGLLVPSLDNKTLTCSCGYKSRSKTNLSLKERAASEDNSKVKESEQDTLAKVKETCPKCNHNEAFNWSMQTRAADEAETQFYRCTKCGHTWREYS